MKKYIIILPIIMLTIPHTTTCSSKKKSYHDGTKACWFGRRCGASAYDTLLKAEIGAKHPITGQDYGIDSDDEDASTRYEHPIRNLDQYEGTPKEKLIIANSITKFVQQGKLTYYDPTVFHAVKRIQAEYGQNETTEIIDITRTYGGNSGIGATDITLSPSSPKQLLFYSENSSPNISRSSSESSLSNAWKTPNNSKSQISEQYKKEYPDLQQTRQIPYKKSKK